MITAAQYAKAFFEAAATTSEKDHSRILDNFVKLLAQNGDLDMHPDIEREYLNIAAQARGIKTGQITFARHSAHNGYDIEHKDIIPQLHKLFGYEVELQPRIDHGIIGGFVLRLGDELIDASLKNSLEKLKNNLASSSAAG